MVEEFADRRVGLIVYGVVCIGLGLLCLLMSVFVLIGATMGNTPIRMTIPSMIVYFGIGILDVILGIGSIQCRRWGYRLMLVWSGGWLILGAFMLVVMAFILPGITSQAPTPGAKWAMTLVMLAVMGTIYVLLPAAFFFFYRIPSVRLTCELRDPEPSWTEARPLPILAATGLMVVGGLLTLPNALVMNQPLPLFGGLLHGVPAILILGVISVIWLAVGWGYWKLSPIAWWGATVLFLIGMVSAMMTFWNPEQMLAMYEAMEMPAEVVQRVKTSGILENLKWIMVGSAVAFLGFQVYLKRFFRRA